MIRPNNGIDPIALLTWGGVVVFLAAVWGFVGWIIWHGVRSVQ